MMSLRLLRPVCLLPISVALLIGCGGGGDGGNGFGLYADSPGGADGTGGGTTIGSGGTGGATSGNCTYVLDKAITTPTRLINTGAYCDYLLDGRVEVESTLIIDPGVVVQAKADARITLDGGQIEAIGTAQNRIVFEGLSHVSGFWEGIDIYEGRPTVFDYVDIKDAGQVCNILFCADAGFEVDDVSFAFTNSSVSNSYAHGMIISRDVELTAFENNRFFGNVWAGLVIPGELVPRLDTASDYAGVGNENGTPYVQIASGSQERGEVFRWKPLNAPYYIGSYFTVDGGTLYIEPGVELVLGEEAWIQVNDNGVIKSMGTASSPVLMRGLVQRPGYWDGIELSYSPWSDNTFTYTTISHTGNLENISPTYAALRLKASQVTLANNVFKDNAEWGIFCSAYGDASTLHDGLGNRFEANAGGNVSSNCLISK